MTGQLEEKEHRCFPCPLHKNVKTSKTYVSDGDFYLVHCPICGLCAKVPA